MVDRLHDRHFSEIARMVESYSGIKLPPAKRIMIEGRLRRRARALGLTNLADYGAEIFERGKLAAEFEHVVDCVTTNKTDFFREPEHFRYLKAHALPALTRGRARRVKGWSSAASIGAEAYTLAMVLAEELGLEGLNFQVLATDLNREVLEQAQRAIYPLAFLDPIPKELRARYVMLAREPTREEFRIVPELRRRVRFARLNLMDESYPVDADFDFIFCRNVLIYFNSVVQRAVVKRLTARLRPGGYLFLGHSESVAGNDHAELKQVASTIFRRAE